MNRYDYVGSFLRPKRLKKARRDFENNTMNAEELKKVEDKEKIIQRIKEASKYIPLERLSLSPQCGFASCEIGNKLTEEEQWAKLKLVKEIAEEVWG